MNVKNNKRRQFTRKKIEEIFIDLLQTKEINQISISDICKKAEINRSTFYANYEDIYALANAIRDTLEYEVMQLYASDIKNKFNSNDYLRLFRHIYENQLLYKTYFKLGYDSKRKINVYDYDTTLADKFFNDKYMDYHMEFFKSGFNAIIKMWLNGGCKETPEEIAEILKSEYQGR